MNDIFFTGKLLDNPTSVKNRGGEKIVKYKLYKAFKCGKSIETIVIECRAIGKNAEIANEYLLKNKKVTVKGYIVSKYQKSTNEVSDVSIVVEHQEFEP